ncbi:MAG: DoxX family protein [Bacteroidota bacterium]
MKRDRIIYLVTTWGVALMMLMSSAMYLTKNPELMAGFQTLGLPVYMIGILGVAKLLGAIALLLPKFEKVKEWAYAGFAFTFIGAVIIHLATNTSFAGPLVFLIVLGVSYFFRQRVLMLKKA